jgi:hypothetical protein
MYWSRNSIEALLAKPYIFHEPDHIGPHIAERLGRHPGLVEIPDQFSNHLRYVVDAIREMGRASLEEGQGTLIGRVVGERRLPTSARLAFSALIFAIFRCASTSSASFFRFSGVVACCDFLCIRAAICMC